MTINMYQFALRKILEKTDEALGELIDEASPIYCPLDIGKVAGAIAERDEDESGGLPLIIKLFSGVEIYLPLDESEAGREIETINGKSLLGYVRIESGLIVPEEVARTAGLNGKLKEFPEQTTIYRPFAFTALHTPGLWQHQGEEIEDL